MLDKEFKYYKEHQKELVEKYNDKFIVIIDENVVGVFDTELKAYTEAKKNHPVGTFLIQRVLSGTDSYTQTFHSRVTFPTT
jgi:hypothetical protein